MNYGKHYNKRETPQREKARSDQVLNSEKGYVFKLDHWAYLKRWLILGSEGGSYYANENKLTRANAINAEKCIAEDGERAVNEIVEVSVKGRAPKNDPAIFALALAAASDNLATKKLALSKLREVCRIPTHLFHFMEFSKGLRGWGKTLREAVADWYNQTELDRLGQHVVKYQSRDGWSNADALRKGHPRANDEARNSLYKYIVDGLEGMPAEKVVQLPAIVQGFEKAKSITGKTVEDREAVIKLITDFNLTREMIPTQFLTEKDVWAALLEKMPMTAMLRNIANMTRIGLLEPLSQATKTVCERLQNEDALRKARVHPMAILVGMKTYASGQSLRGSNTWNPLHAITDAMDEAFYLSFGNVVPVGKSLYLGVDVSSSMTYGSVAGSPLTPCEAAGAMALITAKTEPVYYIAGFCDRMKELNISPRMRLDGAVKKVQDNAFGSTDCAAPILDAMKRGMKVEGFLTYTDNETWAGDVHPFQALKQYRDKTGIQARNIVTAFTSTEFSIADPKDPNSLDVVGFDQSAPSVISSFLRGEI